MKKLRVNISCPNNWFFDNFLKLHSPQGSCIWDEFEFFHNETSGQFDFWVILDQLEVTTKLTIPHGNIFFITMEERDVVKGYHDKYLNQFDNILTSRDDINAHNIINTHYFTKWHVNKSYDELFASLNSTIPKSRDLSAIISSRVQYGQHKKRYAFINKLKGHFKNDLDWFSKNENPIQDKWDGLAPYKYSIAIENSSYSNYFTEKLIDVVLAETIPFYWGAPNINEFFPHELIIKVELDDFLETIDIINNSFANNVYDDLVPLLKESKRKILQEYQFYPWLTKNLREYGVSNSNSQGIKIFKEEEVLISQRFKNSLKRVLKR